MSATTPRGGKSTGLPVYGPSAHPQKTARSGITPPARALARLPLRTRPVSEAALLRRVNRRLRDRYGAAVRRSLARDRKRLGVFHGVDLTSGKVLERHIDLEALGRELHVLSVRERVVEQGATDSI